MRTGNTDHGPQGGPYELRTSMLEDMADIYDAMIDWPKRLNRETPFYRQRFEQHHVSSVLDAACGTGRHAAMFHQWGLRVEGADLSEDMIRRARTQFGEPEGLRWMVRGFDQPVDSAEPFDAVVCVGNSLPLAPDLVTIERAIKQMLTAVRSGGLLIVHALNLWRLPDGPSVWQKTLLTQVSQPREIAGSDASADCPHPRPLAGRRPKVGRERGDVLIIKGIHRCGTRGYVDLLVADPQGNEPLHAECLSFLGLEAEWLASTAQRAGVGNLCFFGGYENEPYDPRQSADLILVLEKP